MKASKIITMLFLMLSVGTAGRAQTKHWEPNFYISVGAPTSVDHDDSFLSHLGFGLNYYFSPLWSIMPGVDYRIRAESGDDEPSIGTYDCTFLDIPIVAQYHCIIRKNHGFIFELGPVFSFLTSQNKYYAGNSNSPLADKDIYNSFDIGIRPGVFYQTGRHWRFGLQSQVGLLNTKKQYDNQITDSYHYADITFYVGFCFK